LTSESGKAKIEIINLSEHAYFGFGVLFGAGIGGFHPDVIPDFAGKSVFLGTWAVAM